LSIITKQSNKGRITEKCSSWSNNFFVEIHYSSLNEACFTAQVAGMQMKTWAEMLGTSKPVRMLMTIGSEIKVCFLFWLENII